MKGERVRMGQVVTVWLDDKAVWSCGLGLDLGGRGEGVGGLGGRWALLYQFIQVLFNDNQLISVISCTLQLNKFDCFTFVSYICCVISYSL